MITEWPFLLCGHMDSSELWTLSYASATLFVCCSLFSFSFSSLYASFSQSLTHHHLFLFFLCFMSQYPTTLLPNQTTDTLTILYSIHAPPIIKNYFIFTTFHFYFTTYPTKLSKNHENQMYRYRRRRWPSSHSNPCYFATTIFCCFVNLISLLDYMLYSSIGYHTF